MRRLLFVGGGHAQLKALKMVATRRIAGGACDPACGSRFAAGISATSTYIDWLGPRRRRALVVPVCDDRRSQVETS